MYLISNEEEVIWYDKFLGYYCNNQNYFWHMYGYNLLYLNTRNKNYKLYSVLFKLVEFGHFITIKSYVKIARNS